MNPGSFAGFARGASVSGPRRATYVLTSSNASFPIPSWAQGGKGIVYVTGCGAGAGSNGSQFTSSASWARGYPVQIPSGVTSVGVVVPAGATPGNQGGEAEFSLGGANVLRLGGGRYYGGVSIGPFPSLWDGVGWNDVVSQNAANAGSVPLFVHAISGWFLGPGETGNTAGVGGFGPFGVGAGRSNGAQGRGFGASASSAWGGSGRPGFFMLEFVEGL